MKDIKITIQFEDFVIPDKEIMMPCVPAVGSWITFPFDSLDTVNCTEFRVTSINFHLGRNRNSCFPIEPHKIYVSVCKNTMINEDGN